MTTPDPLFFINDETGLGLRKRIGGRDYASYQSFSGVDILVAMYLPLITSLSSIGLEKTATKFKVFGSLQTISISSTRSISPVRVLGRSSAVAYTRGARTFAGTMVFATLNSDVFSEVYDLSMAESAANASSSMVSDQLPPFSIIITASNELGNVAVQAIHGITLVNYGTTYSIDDLYTETTYSYVATDVVPLLSNNTYSSRRRLQSLADTAGKTVSDLVTSSMQKAYGTLTEYSKSVSDWYSNLKTNSSGLSSQSDRALGG